MQSKPLVFYIWPNCLAFFKEDSLSRVASHLCLSHDGLCAFHFLFYISKWPKKEPSTRRYFISLYVYFMCKGIFNTNSWGERNHKLYGIRIARMAPSTSHWLFVIHNITFGHANVEYLRVMQNILLKYGQLLGQPIKLQKSSISFSNEVSPPPHQQPYAMLGLKSIEAHVKYLGLSAMIV